MTITRLVPLGFKSSLLNHLSSTGLLFQLPVGHCCLVPREHAKLLIQVPSSLAPFKSLRQLLLTPAGGQGPIREPQIQVSATVVEFQDDSLKKSFCNLKTPPSVSKQNR